MKKLSLFFIHFLLIVSFTYSQEQKDVQYLNKIEEYLLYNQKDSISPLLLKVKKTSYVEMLTRIYNNDNPTFKDYLKFVAAVSKKQGIRFEDVSEFINQQVQYPSVSGEIEYDFVKLKWFQISILRDDVSIDSASEEQENIENYVASFNEENYQVKKAKVLISTHQLVLNLIQREIKAGKQLCLENIEFAKQNNETELTIIFLGYVLK